MTEPQELKKQTLGERCLEGLFEEVLYFARKINFHVKHCEILNSNLYLSVCWFEK